MPFAGSHRGRIHRKERTIQEDFVANFRLLVSPVDSNGTSTRDQWLGAVIGGCPVETARENLVIGQA
jgi:hypothetical protein